jgi:hypothetical protein
MTLDDLERVVDDGLAPPIMEVAGLVRDYLELRSVLDLGLTVHSSEIDFDKVMIFSWIKEEIDNGRKTRV